MIALAIQILCAATSLACGILLYRGYRRTGARLLFWSALCFFGFFLNNTALIIDLRILSEQDFSVARTLPSLAGVAFLLYGLITESA